MKIYRLYTIHQQNRVDITRSTLPTTSFSFDTLGDPDYSDYETMEQAMAHVAYKVADVTYFRHTLPRILIRANVITELDAITDDDGDIVDCEDCGDWFISELPNEVTLGSWNYVKNVDCYERIDKDEQEDE